jgi:hypothetical protein
MRPDRGAGDPRVGRSESDSSRPLPRVVILEADERAHVEVVDLPNGVAPGSRFDHSGTTWCVTGTRTHERVLIARPDRT